ncbi:hypothetical protein [Cryptosporangium sp. NPDC051539]|uniref:hypothetical protein n=1 Tax=Cryptosporangium sp. NPDC051539 TaxID=3363962 RepID=UPI0037AD542B
MDLVDPFWGSLLGLLVLAAVIAAGIRMRGPGQAPMRRAMLTVGGGIVAVFLIGIAAEGCAGPSTGAPGTAVVQP